MVVIQMSMNYKVILTQNFSKVQGCVLFKFYSVFRL